MSKIVSENRASGKLTNNVRLAEFQNSVSQQVTDKVTELVENIKLRSDFSEMEAQCLRLVLMVFLTKPSLVLAKVMLM